MARVKGAVHAKKHHRAVLEQAQGYYGNKSRSFRAANEQVMHSMQYAYRDRRARKGDFRQLWIQRINAAARLNGTSYSRFIAGLHRAQVDVDRKVLADLAVTEPEAFASLVQVANEALAGGRPDRRGRFLTQPGLAVTHQRVRRLRQLLRKREPAQRRAGAGRRGRRTARGGAGGGCPRRSCLRCTGGRRRPGGGRGDRTQALAAGARVFDLGPGGHRAGRLHGDPQPVLAVVGWEPAALDGLAAGDAAWWSAYDVRDPGNVGTVIRTADASGVDAVVCCDGTVDPTNPKCVRATAGSLFHVPIVVGGAAVDVVADLAAAGIRTVGAAVQWRPGLRRVRLAPPGGPGARQRGLRSRRPGGRRRSTRV